MKIEIKCRFSGSVLFSHEAEGNTVKLTVEAAVKDGAYLTGANLADANLDGANLDGANLSGAYLDVDKKLIGNRPIFQIGPIGSRSAYLVAYITDSGICIKAGCFFGTASEFAEKVSEEHDDNNHANEYAAALKLIEKHAELWAPVTEIQEKQPELEAAE